MMFRKIIIVSFIILSSFGCRDKSLRNVELRVFDYSNIPTNLNNFEGMLSLIDCDSTLFIPKLKYTKGSNKDTFHLLVDYKDFTSNILDLDYEATKELYKIEKLNITLNDKKFSKDNFLEYVKKQSADPDSLLLKFSSPSIICFVSDTISSEPQQNGIIYSTLKDVKNSIYTYFCNHAEENFINIYIIGDKKNNDDVELSQDIKNILSNINSKSNKIRNTDINKYLETVDSEIKLNEFNWFLYYLKARILCLQKENNFENIAVENLATAARIAINNQDSRDSLLDYITNLASLEFNPLFTKEKLYKARLDGIMAGLRSNKKELIDVPLYFLTDYPIEGFTKGVPMVHFENNKNIKTYVSRGLNKEIIIQITQIDDSNGVIALEVIDQNSKNVHSEIQLKVGQGKEIDFGSSTSKLYIRNLTDLKKPYISLSIEKTNNKEKNLSSSLSSPSSPEETVKKFLTYLGQKRFRDAYSLSDNPLWQRNGGPKWFISRNAYGGINKINIKRIYTKSEKGNNATVFGHYYADDPFHVSKEWEQNFYLIKGNNGWKIVEVKLDNTNNF